MAPTFFTLPMLELVSSLRREGQPLSLFDAVDRIASTEIGRDFSTSLILHTDGDGERIFSSDPLMFPLGSRKPLVGRKWSEQVISRAEPFLARSLDEIRSAINDTAAIERFGCQCLLNVPVVHDGMVVGTFNLGAREDRYEDLHVKQVLALATLLGPSIAWLQLKLAEVERADRRQQASGMEN